jgi:hypothetical protein
MRKALLVLLLLVLGPVLAAQQPLNNDAVIKLTKAGLSDDLIITTINANPGNYDTSTDGLIALKKAKVSDKVVSALVLKASGASGSAAAPNAGTGNFGGGFNATATNAAPTTGPNGLPVGIDDVGVYYKDKSGAWISLLPEIVNFESGNKFKNIASVGIVKGNLNGHIEGARSRLNATLPVVFAVYLPETVEITEYQMVRLHPTADAREFLSAAGGVLHTNAGATRDEIDFQPEKLAPRLYQVTLPESAGHGEFGLLAPGTMNASNKESSAKIYTVSVAN